ncbi:MarR family winged helix-turn-helix transcriptional regulator [Miniphocaeibacter halophilus]|uniref:MarR family transcriptional regulator n=1 Tax=Miniphocaeibacter halophilus TaxID=2931922 RepID=A0AC61MRP9_9FIRM|nr:MarR family transcriptional regulator [Miniphocaeibacter halophilus]QQK08247.1 MarR family transcriptional regulator [Miniphocaeibacter halophilus]
MNQIYCGKKINILSKKIKWGFDQMAEKYGVTGGQARILHFIVKNGKNYEVYQKEVEEEFNLRRSTVTGILQLIEEKDLITRTISEKDGRVKKIKLTKKGIELQKKISVEINNYEKILIDGIKKEDLEVLSKVLDKIMNNIELNF